MSKVRFPGNSRSGQSLVELMIGLGLMALGSGFAVLLVFGGQDVLADRGNAIQARMLAKQGLDAARFVRDRNWNELSPGDHGISFNGRQWNFSNTSDTKDIFSRKVSVILSDDNTKKILSQVDWKSGNNLRTVVLSTVLTNWINAAPPPDPTDTGGTGTSGDWKNPKTLGSVDLGPGNSATDLDVVNKIVYLTSEAASVSKPDFYIVDATDGANPFIVSNLDTGAGLAALDVSGNTAFVANLDVAKQFQAVNISNRSSPSLITSLKLPGVSGTGAVGNSIFYANSKVYIGTKTANGPEFFVIDVSSPSSPIVLGSKEINADVNGIYVQGDTAYIATSDSEEYKVFDISNPANINQISGLNLPGDSEDGKSLLKIGPRIFISRLRGGNDPNFHEFHILDISSSSPASLGSVDIGYDVNDLKVRDNLAFLGTSNPNEEFQIWNISDPTHMSFWASFNFAQVATGIDYEDNIVYVSVRSNDALRIITSTQ